MKFLAKLLLAVGALGLTLVLVLKNYNLRIYFDQVGAKATMETKDDYIESLREAMLQRNQTVTLNFKGESEEVHGFVSNAINQAFEIDKPSTNLDFDYLRYIYKGTQISIKGLFNAYRVEYKLNYNESKEQTDAVLTKVKKELNALKVSTMNEYDKIKTVHDYIINNATYDISAVHSSAYDNLLNQTSVCQGYAMVTYLMMKEAGIDCRIITGTGKGVSHAWNIVRLNGKWYNIDCTWDDPVSSDGKKHLEYDYFLKSDADFINHIRDFEFDNAMFHKKYKMSDKSYQ